MKNTIQTSGKRKRAIARATLTPGNGTIRINSKDINNIEPKHYRLKLLEPLLFAPEIKDKININITVNGGGVSGQIDAARLAIGRALVKRAGKTSKLAKTLDEYDGTLLVADVRRKESNKPNDSKARAKRQKSYR